MVNTFLPQIAEVVKEFGYWNVIVLSISDSLSTAKRALYIMKNTINLPMDNRFIIWYIFTNRVDEKQINTVIGKIEEKMRPLKKSLFYANV